jgi:signal peptidase II
VIGDNLILTKTENTGAMLGLGSGLSSFWKKVFLWGLPALFILIILGITFFKTSLSYLAVVGLTFIVGGGIGNLIDRIAFGSVTDFLHIDLGLVRTGIFNMADVSVMVGTGLMLLYLFQKKKTTS